jgi:hypothetical protein
MNDKPETIIRDGVEFHWSERLSKYAALCSKRTKAMTWVSAIVAGAIVCGALALAQQVLPEANASFPHKDGPHIHGRGFRVGAVAAVEPKVSPEGVSEVRSRDQKDLVGSVGKPFLLLLGRLELPLLFNFPRGANQVTSQGVELLVRDWVRKMCRLRDIGNSIASIVIDGCGPGILERYRIAGLVTVVGHAPVANSGHGEIRPQLRARCAAGDQVGLSVEKQGANNTGEAQPAQPCGECSGIRCLPLGAQIGISFVVTLLAWFALFGALRPFGLLSVGVRDVAQAVGCLVLSMGLFWLSYRVWWG